MPSTPQTSTSIENILRIASFLIWPLLVIVILILFWKPIHHISKMLPQIIEQSETITIGGMTLKIKNEIKNKPTHEASKALSELSPKALLSLIELGADDPDTTTVISFDQASWDDGHMEELLAHKLVKKVKPRSEALEEFNNFILTSTGVESSLFLVDLIQIFVQETLKQEDDPKN